MTGQRWVRTLAIAGVCLALGACGSYPPLDQAIQCNQFQRQSDGSWITTTDVSLDFTDNGTRNQSNFSKGTTITDKGPQNAPIVAALNKKCAASH